MKTHALSLLGTTRLLSRSESADADQLASVNQYPALEEQPCYRCFDDWWENDEGNRKQPGVWSFTAKQGAADGHYS